MAHKAENIYHLALYRKKPLLTPGPGNTEQLSKTTGAKEDPDQMPVVVSP